jgi:general secretion pathway protein D
MKTMRKAALALVLGVTALVGGCATQSETAPDGPLTTRTAPAAATRGVSPALADAAQRAQTPGLPTPEEKARIIKGTGVVVKGQQAGGGVPPGPTAPPAGGAVVLNFEAADLREVVRNILGDILNESYTIDPTVGGQVTIRSSAGIARDALPATLEMLLRMNGATMVKEAGVYKILPSAAAVRGNVTPQLGNSQRSLPPGFSVQIVPLRYVGLREMLRILEPFAKDAAAVRGDDLRNLLILSGTERELRHLLETVDMFDVDWISGMSVGVFTIQNADVKSLMQEFDKAIGDRATSPLAGILRIIPIERMNAILVITPQPAYLDEVKKWIDRLDQPGYADGARFFVYHLQNQRAEKLAPLLQQAFTGRVTQQAAQPAPTLAPGTPAGTIVSPPAFQPQPAQTTPATPQVVIQDQRPPAATPLATAAAAAAARAGADGVGIVRNVQVVADKDNNTLLIVATASEYPLIEAAVKRLDIPSRQVMIEITIANVTLTDELQFGVEWLFRNAAPSGRGAGGLFNRTGAFNPNSLTPAQAAAAATNPALALAQGFVYIINNANFPGGIQAALHLLDTYGDTKVIANPHLGALDNQKATIKAGDRIPICQQTYVGTGVGSTVNNTVSTTSQYIDTGVLMQVTPHINAGGLVTMDVQVEVSIPGPLPADCSGLAPTINTRSLQSILAVPSGQTMVMGGLITDNKQNSSKGLPLLSRIPIIGGLFGEQTLTNNRTELVMFITPRVVETDADVRGILDDLRRRMERLDEVYPFPRGSVPGTPLSQSPK